MTIDNRGRFEPTANVRHMRWADDPRDERTDGIRIGYGRGFCFVPESQAFDLAKALLDYIESNNLNTNA